MTDTRDSLKRKKAAYVNTFCGGLGKVHPEGERVLADLKKFCGVTKPGIVVSPKAGLVDPYASIYRSGQRDVYLRIAGFLGITESQLFQESEHVETLPKTAAE